MAKAKTKCHLWVPQAFKTTTSHGVSSEYGVFDYIAALLKIYSEVTKNTKKSAKISHEQCNNS